MADRMAKPTPINAAEAVIDPFWDPALSGLRHWTVQPAEKCAAHVEQNWCWVQFNWERPPAEGPVLRLRREFGTDCRDYDQLLLSAVLPADARLELAATTDAGPTRTTAVGDGLKHEYRLPLLGAARLHDVTIAVTPGRPGPANGWFNWLGLGDTRQLPRYLAQHQRFTAEWAPYLQPESYEPSFAPALGIVITPAELERLRARHAQWLAAAGTTSFVKAAASLRQSVPEDLIHGHVNFWGDTRYNRERDHGKLLVAQVPRLAVAGLLLRDRELLRLAARYALSLAMVDHWDDGFICRCPGSTFEHRCFVQSLCAHDVGMALDLCGEWFTPLGRDLLRRRLAEEALGAINFNAWRYDYIFHCNQLAWFSPGRLMAYTVLEREWPRVKPYTDLAYTELVESLGYTVLPDGGYVEGPSYFTCVGAMAGTAIFYYARARGKDFAELMPARVRLAANLADALSSTVPEQDLIPICDGHSHLGEPTLAVMAALCPQSTWVTLYRRELARRGNQPDSLLGILLDEQIPATGATPPAFAVMPEMGVVASTRRHGPHLVKLLLQGNYPGAGHTHEDKGSFVLEYAGETFAMDPGICDYSHALCSEYKKCQRHNMLVPTGTEARPEPACPLPAAIRPAGQGDATAFHATVDVTPGWEGWYRRWQRTWDSPTPDRLVIRDEYELAAGDGVAFLWQTGLPVTVNGQVITIQGRQGTATLTAPSGTTVEVDELPLREADAVQRRISIGRAGTVGVLEVVVQLAANRA